MVSIRKWQLKEGAGVVWRALAHGAEDLLPNDLGVLGRHFNEGELVSLFVVVAAVKRGIPVVSRDKGCSIVFGLTAVRVVRNA